MAVSTSFHKTSTGAMCLILPEERIHNWQRRSVSSEIDTVGVGWFVGLCGQERKESSEIER